MAIGRSLAAAALLTTTLVGCASSASEEPDDSATKPSKASKSDADAGPVQVDGGVAAPGSLTDFDCAPDGDVWSATGTLTNNESQPAEFRVTVVVASPDASRGRAREITVKEVPTGESTDFKAKKLPVASGADATCSVQVALLR